MFDWLLHTAGGIVTAVAIGWLGIMTPATWCIARYWRQIGFWKPTDDVELFTSYEERNYTPFVPLSNCWPESLAAFGWPFFWLVVFVRRVIYVLLMWLVINPTRALFSSLGEWVDRLAAHRRPTKTNLLSLRRAIRDARRDLAYWKRQATSLGETTDDSGLEQQELTLALQQLEAIKQEASSCMSRVMLYGLPSENLELVTGVDEDAVPKTSTDKVAQ